MMWWIDLSDAYHHVGDVSTPDGSASRSDS